MDVMERSGMVVHVGYLVIEKCCALIQQLKPYLTEGFPIPLSVNVSAIQFSQEDFVPQVARILAKYNIAPGEIHFEITESVSALNNKKVIATMQQLTQLGPIALDDFGTGYSSLSYLSTMPVDIVKIDRSFVSQLPEDTSSTAILKAVLYVCRVFGMTTVAEGVETAEQAFYLKQSGCNIFQGYYYSKPMPTEDFIAMVISRANKLSHTA
nr:EAL domain-containing protein [Oceanicoccus sagamiensis]